MNSINNRNRIAIHSENVFELPSKNQIAPAKSKLALNDRTNNNNSALRDGGAKKNVINGTTGFQKTVASVKSQKSKFMIALDTNEIDQHVSCKSDRIKPFALDAIFERLSFKPIEPKPEEVNKFEKMSFDDPVFDLPEPDWAPLDLPSFDNESFEMPPPIDYFDLPPLELDGDIY